METDSIIHVIDVVYCTCNMLYSIRRAICNDSITEDVQYMEVGQAGCFINYKPLKRTLFYK